MNYRKRTAKAKNGAMEGASPRIASTKNIAPHSAVAKNIAPFSFTKAALTAILEKHDGQRATYRDAKTPGLIAEIRTGGSMSFYLYRWLNGRPVRMRLGGFPEITVEQARTQAKTFVGEIAKGNDPHAERLKAKHEHTVGGLFTYWFEAHAKLHKKTWTEDERQFKTFLTPWKNRKLSSIRRDEVQTLHARIGEKHGHYAANRLLALLRAMFNKGVDIGWTGPNPTAGIKKFAEQSRDRFLQNDEIPKFFKALDAELPLFRDFFKLALLTGARRANVQAMRWTDVSLERGEWRIPDTKSGDPVLVHLPAQAVELLQERKDLADESSEWVFATRSKTGHLVEVKTAWKRILTRAGLSNLRIHDLRRTLGSWQAATGASLAIIGKSLGHKNQSTTAIYARLNLDPVRASVNTAVDAIFATAAKENETAKGGDNGKA